MTDDITTNDGSERYYDNTRDNATRFFRSMKNDKDNEWTKVQTRNRNSKSIMQTIGKRIGLRNSRRQGRGGKGILIDSDYEVIRIRGGGRSGRPKQSTPTEKKDTDEIVNVEEKYSMDSKITDTTNEEVKVKVECIEQGTAQKMLD